MCNFDFFRGKMGKVIHIRLIKMCISLEYVDYFLINLDLLICGNGYKKCSKMLQMLEFNDFCPISIYLLLIF